MPRKPGKTREQTRTAILEAAEKEFEANGFAGGSLSGIARRARVTKSLIHYHFHSKEALWQEVKESRFADYALLQRQILAEYDDAREFLRQSFTAYFTFLQRNPAFLRLMWWMQAEHGRSQHPNHDLNVSSSMRTLVEDGIRLVHDLQQRGQLRADLQPRFMFAAFLSLLRHWFVARRDFALVDTTEDGADADQKYLESIISIFSDGVLARP